MAHPIDHGDLGLPLKGQSSRHWLTTMSEEAENDEDVLVVWEDPVPSVGGRDLVCWDDDEAPLEVALLAMLVLCIEGLESWGEQKVGVERRAYNSSIWSRIG